MGILKPFKVSVKRSFGTCAIFAGVLRRAKFSRTATQDNINCLAIKTQQYVESAVSCLFN